MYRLIPSRSNRKISSISALAAELRPVTLVKFAHIAGIIVHIIAKKNHPVFCLRVTGKAAIGKPACRVVNLCDGSHGVQTHNALSKGTVNNIIGLKGDGVV